MQQPTVGRIVHFYPDSKDFPGTAEIAGLITAVHGNGVVSLTLFPFNREPLFRSSVQPRTAPAQTNVWDWPPRV